ncbi:SGNH/GDSL hydrolase family protein [Thermoanaerobacterium thermosaccharolyticum]|uniref:SGNH/GDSL hydrolase family protein n=1 Tax=Thermoanaerobacterium thermosaccharolyticum TaxID=1517 RepID=UPI0017861D95|nr:SGNH/GDSL hydrolase family protein [Thermoanaerobacterium thermosaccharolyticum]MBE0068638.1 SGNH/GDSL hydrolase family protein [Thermoanaerobacterium thermosaccharolyticum]MBE0228616.1 SGNH/GDSL hydrolase family protein [Thermoanaerobacterium thermosaccharolyticum]
MEMLNIKESYNFLVCGDSISRGVVLDKIRNKYVLLRDSYTNLLNGYLKGTVENISKFGSTILKGKDRLARELDKTSPDVVLIEFGGNDCDFNWDEVAQDPYKDHAPNTDFNVFKETLKDLIDSLKKANIVPVLLTLPPLDADRYFNWISKGNKEMAKNILTWLGSVTKIYWWQEKYNSAILSIASSTETKIIDIRSTFLDRPDYRKLICEDGIHPNEEGHRAIAEKIMDYVRSYYDFLLK